MARTSRPKKGSKRRGSHPNRARLDALVEEATADAYGDAEQCSGLFTMIEEHLDLPFEPEILGMRVLVERVDLNEAGEIVAVCRRGRRRQRVPILDLPIPDPAPSGAEWIAASRHWRGGQS